MATTTNKPAPRPTPTYGSNVSNFNPNNAAHQQIANLGQQWHAAAGNTALQKQLHDRANQIRDSMGGGSYNSQTGIHTFNSPPPSSSPPSGGYPPQNPGPTTGYINSLYDAIGKNARDENWQAKNRADAVSLQNSQGLQELFASRGLGSSGENVTATLAQNAARQGTLSDLDMDLAQQLRSIEADRAGALREQSNIDADRALQLAQLSGYLPGGGGQTLAARESDRAHLLNLAGLTGTYNGQRTLAGQGFDADQSQRAWENRFNYGQAVGSFGNGQRTLAGQQAELQRLSELANITGYYNGRPTFDREQYQQNFNYNREQDAIQNAREQARENRLSAPRAGSSSSGGRGSSNQSNSSVIRDLSLPRTVDSMITYIKNKLPGYNNKIYGPKTSGAQYQSDVENIILSNPNLSEKQVIDLYKKFGIPLPQ